MAHIFLSQLKTALNNCIDELAQIHFLFSRNPETDFTRKRKLTCHPYERYPQQWDPFLDEKCRYYDIGFRIVRIWLENESYICIATNLSEEEFSLTEIKKLYKMRWSEETSFRELKPHPYYTS